MYKSLRFRVSLSAVSAAALLTGTLCSCRPGVSGRDAGLIATIVGHYDSNRPPAIRWGGGDVSSGGAEARQADVERYVRMRNAGAALLHRQIDSISSSGKDLAELKGLLHSLVDNEHHSELLDLEFDSTLTRLVQARSGGESPQTVHALLVHYQNLFEQYNHLTEETVSAATRGNQIVRELALPDTLDLRSFRKMTHQEALSWFQVEDEATRELILHL